MQLPKLAFQMRYVRFPQLLQANVLDCFHEADEPGLKSGRQRVDF